MAKFDCATDAMVTTDALENFRQANRRVTNLADCKASAQSPEAETGRGKAATVVNAMALLRMTPVAWV